MNKTDATQLLGDGVQARAAEALGITAAAFSLWPEQLDSRRTDWVLGAAMRLGKQTSACLCGAKPMPADVATTLQQLSRSLCSRASGE